MQKFYDILRAMMALVLMIGFAHAQNPAPILPTASSPQLAGGEFEVEVKVGNSANAVANLFGLSFELNYTNTNFVDVVGTPVAGDFLGNDIIFFPNVEDANGKVSIGVSRKAGQGGVNGNGTVAKVKFKTLAAIPHGTQLQFIIMNVAANDPSGGSIALTPLPLTITVNNPPLPVELVDFRVQANGSEVTLSWRTATETDNYGFEVQRKTAASEFQKIGFVAGNGTSDKLRSYRFTDRQLANGAYFYRLKQIDRNGAFSYSAIVEAVMSLAPETFALRQNHPNPFSPLGRGTFGNPVTTIEFVLGQTQNARLTVHDVLGNEVAVLFNGQAEAGKFYRLAFDAAKHASGVYFYRLQNGAQTQVRKMLLTR